MVDVLDILRVAKDDTVRNVAAMDVVSSGKKRAMEADSPPPISKQILSFIFSRLSTPPSTPTNDISRKGTTQSEKLTDSHMYLQRKCSKLNENTSRIDSSLNTCLHSCIESSGNYNSRDKVSKDPVETNENDKYFSSSEEGRIDLDDVDGSSKSQEEKTSSSSNEQDIPSKYFRCLSIENNQGNHFLYGLVIPLVARILLVSCPNIMCIVEIPVVEREKQTSNPSSSDESFPSSNSSPEECNVEYCRSSSSESRGSLPLQNGEPSQREKSSSEKSSQRGSTLHGSFNCSFITDPIKRERAARLISSSVEALTAKVHVPHHDGSEFTLSRVQPCRHCYVRDKKSRTLCGAKVEYTNGSSCEVTVDDAFRVLALRRPDLSTPIILFTFDCDSHEQTFHECLGYKNSFIIDIKSIERSTSGDETFDSNEKLHMCKVLPRRLSSAQLLAKFSCEKDGSNGSDTFVSGKRSQTLRRNRSSKLLSKLQESRTGEKRERSPQICCKSVSSGASYSHKSAKHGMESNAQSDSYRGYGAGSCSNGLLDTRFTERVASSSDPALMKGEMPRLSENIFSQVLNRDNDQSNIFEEYEQNGIKMSHGMMRASPFMSTNQNHSHSLQGLCSLSAPNNLNTVSSGPVFSAPMGGFPVNSLYFSAVDRSSYCAMPFVYYPTLCMRENFPFHGYSAKLGIHASDGTSTGYQGFDWSSSSKNSFLPPQFGVEQGAYCASYYSPRLCSFPLHETQMSYVDKVQKWYAHSGNFFAESGTKQSPVFREMRSPTFSDSIVNSPKDTNASSDDDSFVRKVASEALAMLGESHGDETCHRQDESL